MFLFRCNLVGASLRRMSSSVTTSVKDEPTKYLYETLQVSQPSSYVFHIEMNRPEKRNAMNTVLVREIGECFAALGNDSDCRAVVLSGKGKIFTSGIDLSDMASLMSVVTSEQDIARKCKALKEIVTNFQDSMSSVEKCSKPVICAIHSACIGAGVDLTSAGDIRFCTSDTWYQVKEVDLGLAADVGTLQRFPKIVGNDSLVRELCFTARKFYADEALKVGYVSRIFQDKSTLMKAAFDMASLIAEKSPVAVQATKEALIYSRDHSVQEGLDYMGITNMALLQSEDVMKAAMASMNKEKPVFTKL